MGHEGSKNMPPQKMTAGVQDMLSQNMLLWCTNYLSQALEEWQMQVELSLNPTYLLKIDPLQKELVYHKYHLPEVSLTQGD